MKLLFSVGLLTVGMLLMPCAVQAQEETPVSPPATPPPPPATAPAAPPVNPEEIRAQVQASVAKAMADVEAAVPAAALTLQNVFGSSSRLSETKVDLELKDVGVRDALQRVLDQAKQKYVIEEDVPNEPKVRLEAKDVRLTTALDMLTQAAGVNWRHEFRSVKDAKDAKKDEGKTAQGQEALTVLFSSGSVRFESVVRIGKKVRSSGVMVTGDGTNIIRTPEIHSGRVFYPFRTTEQRSTFTCPHCKGQATVIRRNVQPNCPTCQRTFHPDWKFCPHDSTPRPATPNAWKFCPICGKEVSEEEAEKNTRTSLFHPEDHLHATATVRGRGVAAPRSPSVRSRAARTVRPTVEGRRSR